ncbi:gp133 [Brochothrix phage A9]|uniref:Gp133 n=1 Tax=Brochothrix phage A9 TaxID=857312 RepID=D9J0T0_9CAUD|nr:gp133 [Brochothrix phage A9]ADJ53167.1 gp133 [Brochothrix phage A9]
MTVVPLPSVLYKDSTTIERQLITLGVISTNQVE